MSDFTTEDFLKALLLQETTGALPTYTTGLSDDALIVRGQALNADGWDPVVDGRPGLSIEAWEPYLEPA